MHDIKKIQDEIDKLQLAKSKLMSEIRTTDTSVMTKKQLQDFAMTLPPIREDLWFDMNEYGFQTGSSVFGGTAEPSDIDWVCQLPARAFTDSCCAVPCGKITQDYIDEGKADFVPMYGNRDGKLYNIICIGNSAKFDAWKYTTELMEGLIEKSFTLVEAGTFNTKWKRVRLFRALCDVLEPTRPLYSAIAIHDAWKYNICKTCGREANNFTCKLAKDYYLDYGVCERCHTLD